MLLRKSLISYIFYPFFVYETLFPNVYVWKVDYFHYFCTHIVKCRTRHYH